MGSTASVLIVEDDPDFQIAFSSLVSRLGYSPLVASCCREGLAMVQEHHPRLVLTDYFLGDGTAVDLIRGVQADTSTSGIPVLVMSSMDESDAALRASDARADGWIVKGDVQEMRRAVSAAMGG